MAKRDFSGIEKEELLQKVLELNNLGDFNSMQKKALGKDIFNSSIVVSAPTASGKTLIAEICALNSVINKRKKVVYTCPLRALANEHYSEFKRKYSNSLNVRVTISTGDFDSGSRYLKNYDVIFVTHEKLDSLQRHDSDWLQDVGLLVLDEIHDMDSDRGPTIEIVATKFRFINPKLQILALSATIPNAKEIAKWLDALIVESDYRPVVLKEGVFFQNEITYNKGTEELDSDKEPISSIVNDTISKKQKQLLVFANTRRNAESLANKISDLTEKTLSEKEKISLEIASEKILNALESPTEQCKKLSSLVKKGVSFHHAGLLQKQRSLIESLFKENKIKVIAATPTLAAGVNLPSHTVTILSLYRYSNFGSERISVREYKQMAGRAGRPSYDSEGRSILIAKHQIEAEDFFDNYINGDLEPVTSRLGIEPVLRMHLLGLIANNMIFDMESLEKFFSKTFYASQYKNLEEIYQKLQSILFGLQEMGFVKGNEKRFEVTELGKRVSELYLDPRSAYQLILSLKKPLPFFTDESYLFAISNTSELYPWLNVPKGAEAEIWESLQDDAVKLPIDVKNEMYTDANLLKKYYLTQLFKGWVSEKHEQELMKSYNMQPGILYSKVQIAEWLCYSMYELGKIIGADAHLPDLAKMRKRIKYGVKEDLLVLTELRGIGRIRARALKRADLSTVSAIKNAPMEVLARVIGSKTAEKLRKELKVQEQP